MLDVYMALSGMFKKKGPKKVLLAVANGFRHEFIKILFTIRTFVQFYEQTKVETFKSIWKPRKKKV